MLDLLLLFPWILSKGQIRALSERTDSQFELCIGLCRLAVWFDFIETDAEILSSCCVSICVLGCRFR